MISPEVLRHYPFFGQLSDSQLASIAVASNEITVESGKNVFDINEKAEALYFLIDGSVELHYIVIDTTNPANLTTSKDFYVSDINPGEPFGLSALIEPYCYTASAVASANCRILKIEAAPLCALCQDESNAAAIIMRHVAKSVMSRLHDTRVQLVAARMD